MPLATRRTAPLTLLVAALALLLAAAVLPSQPAHAARARGIAVPRAFFGMHDTDPTTWPQVPIGSLRLWDSGVAWNQIQRVPGDCAAVCDWTRLDAQVAAANAHGAEVTIVLGQTPSFYKTGRDRSGYLGKNAPQMPQLAAWRSYVRAVATRYAGRVAALQVWNEANVVGFWTGSVAQMASLTFAARGQVTAVNQARHTHTKLLSPAWVARSNSGPFSAYWRTAKVGGKRMGSLVDAVSLSLYPPATGKPEDAMSLLTKARRTLAAAKVRKPIWNTEVNYGLSAGGVGTRPRAISAARQASYVVRTYLLNASAHVQRVFWYSWDVSAIANTQLSQNGVATAAGKAVGVTESWVAGARLQGCARARTGTYTCTLSAGKSVRRVYWNPTRTATVKVAKSATSRTTLYGVTARQKGGSALKVDYRPVLVRSAR
jgi:hypothetical protein